MERLPSAPAPLGLRPEPASGLGHAASVTYRDGRGRFAKLVCVNAHDRCDGGPCTYCEIEETKR